MSASVREQIVEAVVAALTNNNPPAPVYRSRVQPLSSAETLPAYVVYPHGREPAERLGMEAVKHTLTLRVEALVKGQPPLDQALDPLLTYAVQTISADPAVAALVIDVIEESAEWEMESAYEDVGAGAQDFTVTYATLRGDPTTQASD